MTTAIEPTYSTANRIANSCQCRRANAAASDWPTVSGVVPAARAFWQAMMAPSSTSDAMLSTRYQVQTEGACTSCHNCAGSRSVAIAGKRLRMYSTVAALTMDAISAIGQQVRNDARYSLMASSMTPPMARGAAGCTYIFLSPSVVRRPNPTPKVTEFSALALTVPAAPFYATGCIQIAIISTNACAKNQSDDNG